MKTNPSSKFAIIGALIATGLTLSTAFAESPGDGTKPPGPQKDPAARVEKMKQELGLTEDQAQSIRAVMESTRATMNQIRDDASLSEEARKEKAKATREDGRAKVAAVLTAEQKAKWESMKKEPKNKEGKPQKDKAKKPNPDKTET